MSEMILKDAKLRGDTVYLDLWYPPRRDEAGGNARFVEVGLSDVRGADSIRISYDFDRDGWKIEQASTFSWEIDDKVRDRDWAEVAFIQAWAREKPDQPHQKESKP